MPPTDPPEGRPEGQLYGSWDRSPSQSNISLSEGEGVEARLPTEQATPTRTGDSTPHMHG